MKTGVVAAGAVLVAGSAGVANAGGSHGAVDTHDQVGALNGNQVVAPVQAPVNICGIAASVLGTAGASCEGGAEAEMNGPGSGDVTTYDNTGLGNGNQAVAPVQAPVDVSGIAAGVAGGATAGSEGGSDATLEESGRAEESATTTGNDGALSGNQLLAPVQAPVNACGNAVAVFGGAAAGCEGGAEAEMDGMGGSDLTTTDNDGIGNGNQAYIPVQAPVNVCGNAIAIFGTAYASCEGGSEADIDEPHEENTKGHLSGKK